MYSWDFGSSWEYVKISETKFDVENIIIEPTNTATYFVVVGLDHNGIIFNRISRKRSGKWYRFLVFALERMYWI